MMSRLGFPLYIALASASFVAIPNVIADEVAVPVGVQGNQGIQTPGRSWTQSKVQESFGAPQSLRGPVGEPAITVWNYGEFSVYFEYDRVLHSVIHHQTAQN